MRVCARGGRRTGRFSVRLRTVAVTLFPLLLASLAGCGGGSFDTGGPRDETLFLGTTNLQQINDYFVTFQAADSLTCAEPGCHGSNGALGGGGFKFRPVTWAQLTPEEQIAQQLAFETRVDISNKLGSTFLLRATESSHAGSINGNIPRYTAGDQIYTWIEEWLQSTPAQ